MFTDKCSQILTLKIGYLGITTAMISQIDLRVNNTVIRDQFLWVSLTSEIFVLLEG